MRLTHALNRLYRLFVHPDSRFRERLRSGRVRTWPTDSQELIDARYISFHAEVRHSDVCIWPGTPKPWRRRVSWA
jgi:hypothetical protein